jgi:hypothetical protein
MAETCFVKSVDHIRIAAIDYFEAVTSLSAGCGDRRVACITLITGMVSLFSVDECFM